MASYNVEGVVFPRPFKIRRLSHVGLNIESIDEGLNFYGRALGFRITDLEHLRDLAPPGAIPDFVTDDRAVFMTYNTDHHSWLLTHKTLGSMSGDNVASDEITLSHFTWQVGSLKEVSDAVDYLGTQGVKIRRMGRDMPGSNWHVYFLDPDGHTVELCYGMEQVGINGKSKPKEYFYRRFMERPPLPQMCDFDEQIEATAQGADMNTGYSIRDLGIEAGDKRFDVAGYLLPRPFKITNSGPVGLFVNDLDVTEAFYRDTLGFTVTERITWKGHECSFLRHGREHHSIKLYPIAARADLGLSANTTTVSVGLQVGSYKQLCDAKEYMKNEGYTFVDLPQELSPGIDYCAHVIDKEGHCMQLYYYMEQLGWDGRTRPPEQRRVVTEPWPESLDAQEDTYMDQTFMGPLG